MDEKNTNIEDVAQESVEPVIDVPEAKESAETVADTPEAPETIEIASPTPEEKEDEMTSSAEDSAKISEEDSEETPVEIIPSVEPIKKEIPAAPTATYRWDYQEQRRVDNARTSETKKGGKLVYASVFALVFLCSILLLVGALFLGEMSGVQGGNAVYGSLSDLYDECYPSYVALRVTTKSGTGVGSGVIITSNGYIATNYHVVEDAVEISVVTSDETTYEAEFIDGDELNDIAVIKVVANNLTAAKLGSSKNSKVGDQVMAIGTPHSFDYRGTMTSGYISALDRRFVEQNSNGTVKKVLYMIQTDTSVNPGNSGGPLFNMNGEVIGIVSLKIAGTNYEGLGFAIPMESVVDMIDDIIRHGRITDPNAGGASQGAALGITGYAMTKDTTYLRSGDSHFRTEKDEDGETIVIISTILGEVSVPLSDNDLLEAYGIKDYTFYTAPESGIYVVSTSEGFDSEKKLRPGDILVSADGIACKQMLTLKSQVADKRVGDTIEFEVFRDEKLITVIVELGKSKDEN